MLPAQSPPRCFFQPVPRAHAFARPAAAACEVHFLARRWSLSRYAPPELAAGVAPPSAPASSPCRQYGSVVWEFLCGFAARTAFRVRPQELLHEQEVLRAPCQLFDHDFRDLGIRKYQV